MNKSLIDTEFSQEAINSLESLDAMGEAEFDGAMQDEEVTAGDISIISMRLAQLMAEEVDLLEEMKIKDVAALQHEKSSLITALESIKRQFTKNPELVNELSEDEKEDLREVAQIFEQVAHENVNKIKVAKEVNHQIIRAISDVMTEAENNGSYNGTGKNEASTMASPITLNEKV